MLDQVVKNNNNRLDNWLGISYTAVKTIYLFSKEIS